MKVGPVALHLKRNLCPAEGRRRTLARAEHDATALGLPLPSHTEDVKAGGTAVDRVAESLACLKPRTIAAGENLRLPIDALSTNNCIHEESLESVPADRISLNRGGMNHIAWQYLARKAVRLHTPVAIEMSRSGVRVQFSADTACPGCIGCEYMVRMEEPLVEVDCSLNLIADSH